MLVILFDGWTNNYPLLFLQQRQPVMITDVITSSLFQMRMLLSLAFLIITAHTATYFRLNTNQQLRLNVGDSLISTMGLFKATLLQNQCTLSISNFNGNSAYTNVGNYTSPTFNGTCNALVIDQGKVMTDNNFTYLSVGSSFNISTLFTIDDWGVIRLVGTYQLPDFRNQESFEVNVTTFRSNNSYIYTGTQANIAFTYQFGPILNKNNWEFSTFMGQFEIAQYDNPGLYVSYSYSSFKLNNSLIYDFPGNTFPATIFPNITFQPRCMEPRVYITFKAPYTLVLDQFWPIATVYEQGRYKVAQISYASVFQPQAWQNSRRLSFRDEHSVCPPFTFEFRGQCVTTCPFPYYYEMRGEFGDCVLTCQEYTPQNDTSRICSCYSTYEEPTLSSLNIQTCPQNSSNYPYGCYCSKQNEYFDRTLSFSCVTTCPQSTFASNGLCMECPARCLTCQVDKLYRSYLECIACESGYKIVNGQCYRICNPGQGNSLINGACQACSDPNCLDCSTNVGVCNRCNALYAVSNGACIQKCLNGTQISFFEDINSICIAQDSTCSSSYASYYKNTSMLKCMTCVTNTYLHAGKCVISCPTNFSPNANNYCICNNGTLTVNNECLSVPACPIKMGWDVLSSSCVSCQFGCLSCHDNWCTSCFPGYFLYISPQGVFCRRKSPLYACDQQYGWINNACILKEFNNPLYRLTSCLARVTNCQACFPNSDTFCSSCQAGYFNFNNTCISSCPNGTIPYQGLTCILPEISNCAQPYLQLPYQAVIVNYNKIQNSDPYSYWTFNGRAAPNDPVGYIPVFQQLTSRKDDGLFRNTQFYSPTWTCLKCVDGQGLNADFSGCSPCPSGCLKCYMARNDSCLQTNTTTFGNCSNYVDYQTGQCINNCSSADYYPYVSNGILYCYPVSQAPSTTLATIDSSTYLQPDGTTQVFFILDQNMQSQGSVIVPITKSSGTPVVASNGNIRVSATTQNAQITNGFLHLQDTNTQNNLWILNASGSVQKLASSSNVALSNTVYGVSNGQSHNTFMRTWLAYIGYIMGPVLICLHAVFIGNDLLYKVDNTLILAQSLYFLSFVKLLVGQLLSQFYYGWLYAQFGFFPNFFENTIPSNYVELTAPNSYKLSTMDANIVRNAGWAFSLFLVFLGGWAVLTFICWLLKSVCHKPDAWHPRIAVNTIIGCGEFLSFPVFYWAVANLMYIGDSQNMSSGFNSTSKAVSIFFIIFICIYGTGRWFFNVLGGLYMYKRIIMATILAGSYLDNRMLAPLVIMEVVFCVVRYIVESPEKYKHIWMMIIECLLHISVYLLGYLSLSAGANTIIMSLVIFIMIVIIAYGLTELYLESRNQWQMEQKDDFSSEGSMARAERRGDSQV